MALKLNILGKIISLVVGKIVPIVTNIFAKIKNAISGILGKLLTKYPKLNDLFMAVANRLSRLREKFPSFADKDLSKVYRNPWVIANGVILVIALAMTAVIISWFQTQTKSIDDAMETLEQLQTEAINEAELIRKRKLAIDPFIIKEEVIVREEGAGGRDDMSKEDKEIIVLLEKANELFGNGQYGNALPFYYTLSDIGGELLNLGLINLRIGECNYNQGFYQYAITAFNKIPVDDNGPYKWHGDYLIGESYLAMGNFDKGRKVFYKLIAMSGKCPEDAKNLIERSYFRIADSYLEESMEKLNSEPSLVEEKEN